VSRFDGSQYGETDAAWVRSAEEVVAKCERSLSDPARKEAGSDGPRARGDGASPTIAQIRLRNCRYREPISTTG